MNATHNHSAGRRDRLQILTAVVRAPVSSTVSMEG